MFILIGGVVIIAVIVAVVASVAGAVAGVVDEDSEEEQILPQTDDLHAADELLGIIVEMIGTNGYFSENDNSFPFYILKGGKRKERG